MGSGKVSKTDIPGLNDAVGVYGKDKRVPRQRKGLKSEAHRLIRRITHTYSKTIWERAGGREEGDGEAGGKESRGNRVDHTGHRILKRPGSMGVCHR